jgi:hypothetical protein
MAKRHLLSLALTGTGAFLAGLAVASGSARAQQPYMVSALDSLLSAQASLQQAAPNKGGHREQALALVGQAIAQVRAGIAYAAN